MESYHVMNWIVNIFQFWNERKYNLVEVFDKFWIKFVFLNNSKIDDNRHQHAVINDKDGVVINDHYLNGCKNTNIGDGTRIDITNVKREDEKYFVLELHHNVCEDGKRKSSAKKYDHNDNNNNNFKRDSDCDHQKIVLLFLMNILQM